MTKIVRERVAIIGAGHVGSTAAFALMLRALFREIVLVDADEALAQAEAADLRDANALARPARIWAGDYDDAASAGIVILIAGAATHGTEDRLQFYSGFPGTPSALWNDINRHDPQVGGYVIERNE